MLSGGTPDTDSVIIRRRGEHLMIDWIPRHTVDCSAVSAQHGDGLIPPHMEDVDLHILRARRYEGLVKAAKAAMDRVEALGDPHKLPNKGPGSYIPHVDALSGDVEQGVPIRVVGDERHDGVILLDQGGVRQFFKVVRPEHKRVTTV